MFIDLMIFCALVVVFASVGGFLLWRARKNIKKGGGLGWAFAACQGIIGGCLLLLTAFELLIKLRVDMLLNRLIG